MFLAIDAGNTRIKWALHDGRAWQDSTSVARDEDLTGLRSAARRSKRCALCNVGGAAQLTRLQQAVAPVNVQVLTAQANAHGVSNRYCPPQALGTDRWCALLALRHQYGSGLAVLAGTALVIDPLAADGVYTGGLIVPGLHAMLAAVQTSTGLQATDAKFVAAAYRKAQNTQDALVAGALYAALGAIERRWREHASGTLVVAGGDGALLAKLLPKAQSAPNLVLDGILLAAQT